MFQRVPGLLSSIPLAERRLPRRNDSARRKRVLTRFRERQEQKNSRHDWRKVGAGGGRRRLHISECGAWRKR
jgi:hypothetical protein